MLPSFRRRERDRRMDLDFVFSRRSPHAIARDECRAAIPSPTHKRMDFSSAFRSRSTENLSSWEETPKAPTIQGEKLQKECHAPSKTPPQDGARRKIGSGHAHL